MKPFCDGAGELGVGSRAVRKAERSVGRGGGVGGTGVVVIERVGVGVDADGSMVSDSHSLVTA